MAFLAIAHPGQKLVDCARRLGGEELRQASAQYQIVEKLREGMPLYNDFYSAILVWGITNARE